MLKRLRFENWRSLRNVTIDDLTPITVFIGANSSGKTNVVEALRFMRYAATRGPLEAVFAYQNNGEIRTLGIADDEETTLAFTFQSGNPAQELEYTLKIGVGESRLLIRDELWVDGELMNQTINSGDVWPTLQIQAAKETRKLTGEKPVHAQSEAMQFVIASINRWQILAENFMPELARATLDIERISSLYSIDTQAKNTVILLDFMRQTQPAVAQRLEQDLATLLNHVETISTVRGEHETRIEVQEKNPRPQNAPTISSGTARMMAMLISYYLLDTLYPSLPGLVVIEEPDTALNPGILSRFVEQLRIYAQGERPRQFILTTHNPAFLDYFQPEEVRVVSRGEDGYTKVERVPEHIRDIWLDEYGLGEVWMTNSFGGLAE